MKAKPLFLALLAVLAVGGLWFARDAWRTRQPPAAVDLPDAIPGSLPKAGNPLQPPNPNRKFEKLTPEQRVQLARKGPIGG